MEVTELNVWAVLVAGLAYYAIGGLWYSPVLFGNVWVKLRGINKFEMKSSAGPMIGALFVNLASAFVLALLLQLTEAVTLADGLTTALVAGVSVALAIGLNHLFEGAKFQMFVLTVGYHLIAYAVMGLILGAWQ
ncbi:MAG TPA: DUF1761 domain-containing protein [Bacilli bacterium]|nr:DUF1761 domain-containing protein [Bacilli bacterium]